MTVNLLKATPIHDVISKLPQAVDALTNKPTCFGLIFLAQVNSGEQEKSGFFHCWSIFLLAVKNMGINSPAIS